jgi:hypothetical protein
METTTIGTNTLPTNNVGIVNLEQNKKPYDVKIKNNSKEAKVKANTKYTDNRTIDDIKQKLNLIF